MIFNSTIKYEDSHSETHVLFLSSECKLLDLIQKYFKGIMAHFKTE
jgi:hypothetical protein